jgi:alkanesulfonate monooxygenase SsuD/methylene tetrahydromethanopterin reductase-like flavin-dependent oxidoreductase (luciferase family)
VTIIKGLFGEGAGQLRGQHYRVTNLTGGPRPIQRPGPPLLIAAAGRASSPSPRARPGSSASTRAPAGGGGLDRADIDAESVGRKATLVREAAGLRWEMSS